MTGSVGMLGLGIMGGAMSANLIEAGFGVVGFDIDPARCEMLGAKGGEAVSSPRDLAAKAEIVISSLPSPQALEAVIHGENGLLAAGCKGLILAETSTLAIEDKQRAHDALLEGGMIMLDCPLSGSGAQAVSRDLLVYASGDRDAFERCVPVFAGFSSNSHYVGAFGNGSKMKFIANLLVGIHNVAAAEAMVLGMKAGLDAQEIYDAIAFGAGGSRMFQVRGPMMVEDSYDEAAMKLELWQKDMKIISEFADFLGSPTPLFEASTEIYKAAMEQGRGEQDTASVCAVLQAMAGLERPESE